MSASYLIDLQNTCILYPSLFPTAVASGLYGAVLSGAIIGQTVDMLHANGFTNLLVVGVPAVVGGPSAISSGGLRVAVQTSDTDVSGSFTDPTSGLAQMPTGFASGGVLVLNSGGLGTGTFGAGVSGQFIASGFMAAAAFQRPGRYCRANSLATDAFVGPFIAGFVGQLRTTGAGGGFAYGPGSGTVSV